jgi:hypothetical protein
MGGNALKAHNLESKRLDAPEFHLLCGRLLADFSSVFPGVRIEVIPSYRTKADFGDLDLLVAREPFVSSGGVEALEDWVRAAGFSRGQVRNGAVTSVEWRDSPSQAVGFQVDFITAPEKEFDTTIAYFSYNDLGNLMGRIAHKMGMVYGHEGLLFPMRDGTHEFDRIQVSGDARKAMVFLGYSPARFDEGFNDLVDIYEFVVSSPYFNRDIYLLENRNHVSRTRDRKRKTYRGFLEWIEHRSDLPAYEYPEEKSAWIPQIKAAFPEFEREYQASVERLAARRFVSERFNGDVVSELTGLSGQALSKAMRHIKQTLGSEEIERRLRADGIDGLRDIIVQSAVVAVKSPRP